MTAFPAYGCTPAGGARQRADDIRVLPAGGEDVFLTRMALDINRRDTVELLASAQRLSMAVRAAFAGGNMHPLYRVDQIGSRQWLVVLSALRPSLYAAHERYGYLGVFPSWETFDYDDTLDEAEHGTVWRFELVASPTGLLPEAEDVWLDETRLNDWLRAQSSPGGFELRTLLLMRRCWVEQDDGVYLLARWRGTLRVTDEERFRHTEVHGIGAARELGAGLMTLSRADSYWDE